MPPPPTGEPQAGTEPRARRGASPDGEGLHRRPGGAPAGHQRDHLVVQLGRGRRPPPAAAPRQCRSGKSDARAPLSSASAVIHFVTFVIPITVIAAAILSPLSLACCCIIIGVIVIITIAPATSSSPHAHLEPASLRPARAVPRPPRR